MVRVTCGALDNWDGDIALRGVIDPAHLIELWFDEYQREKLRSNKIDSLKNAYRSGTRLPDIELSLRNDKVMREGDGTFWLNTNPYVVDGQQRVLAAIDLMTEEPNIVPRIGALIHVGKSLEWERDRFEVVNLGQTRVSSNITLRNLRHKLVAARVLYELATNDTEFVLRDRVTYGQNARKNDLISAVTLFKVSGMVHSHMGAGRSTNVIELAKGLEKILGTTNETVFAENMRLFFDIVDTAWGIRQTTYGSMATHVKINFLQALARLFSSHLDFWEGERLQITSPVLKRLSRFNLADKGVKDLVSGSSGGESPNILFNLLKDRVQTASKPLTSR